MKNVYILKSLISLLFSIFLVNITMADKYYVSESGNNSDGSTWTNGYTSLQTALGAVATGDTIYIMAGIYTPHASDSLISFAMVQDVEIYGGFSGTESFGDANFMENRDFELYEVILSGDLDGDDNGFTNNTENTLHIISSAVSGAKIDGVTISGGNGGDDYGGAAKITAGDITFNNVIFKYNTANYGGAISLASSTFVISNSVFYNNKCSFQAGAIFNNASSGSFTNVDFLENYNPYNSYAANSQVYQGSGVATVTFVNTILWNETTTSGNYFWGGGNTISYSYCLVKDSPSTDWDTSFGADGGNNISGFPWIANQTSFDLFDISPAINAGNVTNGNNIGYYQDAGEPLKRVYVKADAVGTNDGTSWANGYTNLRNALTNEGYGSMIVVAKGTYTPDASIRGFSFDIPEGVFLYGGFAGNEGTIDQAALDNRDFETNETILSGDLNGDDDGFTNNAENSYIVLEVNSIGIEFDIDGFTVTGGNADGSTSNNEGGGIYIYNSKVNLNNIHFKYNFASKGGAIFQYNSTCDFSNMFLNHNDAYTGSMFYLYFGNVDIFNVTATQNGLDVTDNIFYNSSCNTEIINTIFWDNYNEFVSSDANVTISYSIIQGNGESGAGWNTAWGADGGNNKDEFPYFADYKNDDVRLIANSVANGTGNGTYGANMGYFQGTAVPIPDPYYVKADAFGSYNGSDWTNADTSLMNAIDQSIASQKIYVAQGTYYPHVSDRSSAFYLKDYVEIYGGFVGNEGTINQTVIDDRDLNTNKTTLSGDIDKNGSLGGNSYNVFDIRDVDSTAVLDGFEISDGYAVGLFDNREDRGAGIFLFDATPVLRNLQIVENYAKWGGGMYLYTANPDLINISILNNNVSDGGSGIQFYSNSSPDVHNMIVYHNDASVNQVEIGTGCVPTYTNTLIIGSGGSINWNTAYGTDGGNNLDTLPYIKDPYNSDYRLLIASPAIGAGNATYGNNIGYDQSSGQSMPNPIYVKVDAGGADNGTSWTDAFTELDTAIEVLAPHQEIYVAKGIYNPDVSDITKTFELKEYSKIYGSFNGDETVNQTVIDNRDFENNISILSGDLNNDDDGFNNNTDNSYHVIKAIDLSQYTLLDGFEISGGYANNDAPVRQGGGIYSENSNTTYRNLKIVKNYADGRSGGFHNNAGDPVLENITISNNYSDFLGGGFANVSGGQPILTNVIIWGNDCSDSYPDNTEMQLLSTSVSFENCLVPGSGGSSDWQAGFGTDLGNNQDTIPYFVSYSDNDIRLLDKSTMDGAGKAGVGNNIGFYQGAVIPTPMLTITEALTDFGDVGVGSSSTEQSYTVSGSNLLDDVLIVVPSEFEISLTSGNYSGNIDSLILSPSAGTLTSTTIYTRFSPTSGGVKTGEIDHQSYGLQTTDTIGVSGTGAEPAMTVDNSTINFGNIELYNYADEVSYNVSAVFLTDDMIIAAPNGFEISLSSGDYTGKTDTITLIPVNGTINTTTIYVRFMPEIESTYALNIKHITTGLNIISKSVIGTGIHSPVYFVDALASGNNDGANWDNAYTSLATALSEVSSGDTIVVAKGTYTPAVSGRSNKFEMVAGVKVFGGFSGIEEINQATLDARDFKTNETILSGDLSSNDVSSIYTDNVYTVVMFDAWDAAISNSTVLDGFTISGGYANGSSLETIWGGGIYMKQGASKDCSPVLKNLIIKDNTAQSGGGIYMASLGNSYATTAPIIENVVFNNNDAYESTGSGGAIYMSATINCDIDPTIKNAVFINNSAGATAGGIYMLGGSVGNPGHVSASITNATFYGNTCESVYGSAFYSNGQEGTSDPVLNNVIFYGNSETQIHSFATPETAGISNPTYNNCLITGSPSTSWNSDLGTDGGGNITGDPLLVDPSNGDVSVLSGSPVLGTGDGINGDNIGYYQGAGYPAPEVTVTASLNDFGTIELGNTSAEQSFSVSGSNLLGNITITPPTGFEVSLTSGSGFISELQLTPTTGTVAITTIYVRFKPLATGNHDANLTISSPGEVDQTIAVTAYAGGSPEISTISDASICSSNELNTAFTVSDDDLANISFALTSSNTTAVPNANLKVTGSAGSYVLNVIPVAAGSTNISVQVTDAASNTASTTFTLTIAEGPSLTVDFSPITCAYDGDAQIVLSSSGGTGTVTYQLNDWGYSAQTSFTGLSLGDYTAIAKDAGGCTDTSDVYTVVNPSEIAGGAVLTQEISCYNVNDAIITASASGGWGGFEYSLDGVTFQASPIFENLSAEYYPIYVKDSEGCGDLLANIQVLNPDELVIDYINTTNPSGGDNGEISVVAYGGTYPLSYALNNVTYQENSYFTSLTAGTYTVYVKDANECTISDIVSLVATAIHKKAIELNLNLYPNPVSETAYFDLEKFEEKPKNIQVFSLSGQKVIQLNPDQIQEGKINVSDLSSGTFVVVFTFKDKVGYQKIVVKK